MSTETPEFSSEELNVDDEVINAFQRHAERDMEFSDKARIIAEEVQK